MKNRIGNEGYSLVELIVVIAIIAIMVGVTSFGLGMMFTRDANYVAVRIDDELTEARTLAMSRSGKFRYEVHIDSTVPKNSYVRIVDTTNPVADPVRNVLLDKGVTVKINDVDSTDFSVEFDKAKGYVTKVSINGTDEASVAKVYSIEITSKKNTSKVQKVILVSTTGRHYTEK